MLCAHRIEHFDIGVIIFLQVLMIISLDDDVVGLYIAELKDQANL